MSGQFHRNQDGRLRHQGFTLVEVLVAILLLSIGVVAALLIFPRGFETFTETQNTEKSLHLVRQWVTEFEDNPGNVPDAILPANYRYSNTPSDILKSFDFDDTMAMDYRAAATGTSWYAEHLYPLSGGKVSWPLWQPRSVRVPRYVKGEQCVIPAEFSDVNAAGSAVNVAFLPKYLPRFGPILPTGTWDGTQYSVSTAEAVHIYDIRYRRVSDRQLDSLMEQTLPDRLYYAVDYENARLQLLPESKTRSILLSFYYLDNATPPEMRGYGPRPVDIPASGNMNALQEIDLTSVPGFPGNFGELIPNSELLNRAYVYDDAIAAIDPVANTAQYFDSIAQLESGKYYIELRGGSDSTNMLLGSIFFSKEDAGRTVKIDYTVADWNILHEDVTVDDGGYVTLSLSDLKISNNPAFPREPNTWGLYGPMENGSAGVVMGAVELRTGAMYHVQADDPGDRQPRYSVVAQGGMIPNPLTAVDFSQVSGGRIRLGGGDSEDPDWEAQRGKTYRVFYRAQRDWTMQVIKPPSMFWRTNDVTNLGWDKFAAVNDIVSVPGVYEGQSVSVNYSFREDLCRVTADVATNAKTAAVTRTDLLTVGMVLDVINPSTSPEIVDQVKVQSIDSPTNITLVDEPSVAIEAGAVLIDHNSPLYQVSGEVHTVPERDTNGVSAFKLRHLPAANTTITVRGVSVTVRALWVQPRSGTAFVFNGGAGSTRTINERWQSRAVTVILPLAR